jgi:hypothetical protein
LRGIDEQVAKAQRAVEGHAPVKRNRYIQLTSATKSVNRTLEAKTRALAGWKGYTTNLTGQTPEFVIGAYHQLWRIEKAFRMSKHDLQARPIYHHTRDSIEAHLSIVFAAMAVSHWIEHQTGWSIKKFVRTARHYRTVKIKAGRQTGTAADPLPDDLRDALAKIGRSGMHSFGPTRAEPARSSCTSRAGRNVTDLVIHIEEGGGLFGVEYLAACDHRGAAGHAMASSRSAGP